MSVMFSCSVVSDSLRPHGLQHARLPCTSSTPRACSNSCPDNYLLTIQAHSQSRVGSVSLGAYGWCGQKSDYLCKKSEYCCGQSIKNVCYGKPMKESPSSRNGTKEVQCIWKQELCGQIFFKGLLNFPLGIQNKENLKITSLFSSFLFSYLRNVFLCYTDFQISWCRIWFGETRVRPDILF